MIGPHDATAAPLVLLAGLIAWEAGPTDAQQRPTRGEVWDLKLGAAPRRCPTNSPTMPAAPMADRRHFRFGWNDFRRCRPEPDGLREVYFRYDDELEYWAKANNFADRDQKYSGTKIYDFPVVLSARFDDSGIAAGSASSATRATLRATARRPTSLRNFLTARFGREGWDWSTRRPRMARRRSSAPYQAALPQDGRRWRVAELQTNYLPQKRPSRDRRPHGAARPRGNSKAWCASS